MSLLISSIALLVVLIVGFQETRTPLLAFSLLTLEGDPSTTPHVIETAYLYDPVSQELRAVRTGDSLQWSSSGRYLAILDRLNSYDGFTNFPGYTRSFAVYDIETGELHTQDYDRGTLFSWSPDESYLIAMSRAVSSSGSVQVTDIFAPDGSQSIDTLSPSGIGMGVPVSVSARGWTQDGHLLVSIRDAGAEAYYALVDLATGERTTLSGELPPFMKIENPYTYDRETTAVSQDYAYAAVTRYDGQWYSREAFTTYLMIIQLETGEIHHIPLPVAEHALIGEMVWRPCVREIGTPGWQQCGRFAV
jgi:hypothetical protein